MPQISHILQSLARGEGQTADDLLGLVYEELRVLARSRLDREKQDSIQPTELVHEAYLRLVGDDKSIEWNGRGHFFGAAAEAMRRIMVERARKRRSQMHGGGVRRVEFVDERALAPMDDDQLLELDDALTDLERKSSAHSQLVKLRFFAGLTNQEAADVLGISTATAQRQWAFARSWLHRRVKQ